MNKHVSHVNQELSWIYSDQNNRRTMKAIEIEKKFLKKDALREANITYSTDNGERFFSLCQ